MVISVGLWCTLKIWQIVCTRWRVYWAGEIFNATDHSRFTVLECAEAASRAAGKDGSVQTISIENAANTMGDFAECLTLDQH